MRIVTSGPPRKARRMGRATWAMAAFFYTDGRRELRRVPSPPPAVMRVLCGPPGPVNETSARAPKARFFRLRLWHHPRERRDRWIYEEFASAS